MAYLLLSHNVGIPISLKVKVFLGYWKMSTPESAGPEDWHRGTTDTKAQVYIERTGSQKNTIVGIRGICVRCGERKRPRE